MMHSAPEEFYFSLSQLSTQASQNRMYQQDMLSKFYLNTLQDAKPDKVPFDAGISDIAKDCCAIKNTRSDSIIVSSNEDEFDLDPESIIVLCKSTNTNDILILKYSETTHVGVINIKYSVDANPCIVSTNVNIRQNGIYENKETDSDISDKFILYEIF